MITADAQAALKSNDPGRVTVVEGSLAGVSAGDRNCSRAPCRRTFCGPQRMWDVLCGRDRIAGRPQDFTGGTRLRMTRFSGRSPG